MKMALLIVLMTASLYVAAEDENYEFDMDFNIKGKSTIKDFPLQEVDSQELSNAVIEGALQKTSAGSRNVSVKSAHAEQLDSEGKATDSKLSLSSDQDEEVEEEWRRANSAMLPDQEVRMPVFQEPNGRTMDHNVMLSNER